MPSVGSLSSSQKSRWRAVHPPTCLHSQKQGMEWRSFLLSSSPTVTSCALRGLRMKEERFGSHYPLCGTADGYFLAMRETSARYWPLTCVPWSRDPHTAPSGIRLPKAQKVIG